MKKEDIRIRIKAQKALLSDQEKAEAAAAAFALLETTASFMMAEKILMYHSLPDEISTLDFLDRWGRTKKFFLPRVNGVNLDILPFDRSALRLGAFQIEEPAGDDTVDIDEIEMIIVPGIAYDKRGNRVGRGKGYYDRLLAEAKALKVGLAYDFQLVDEIEAEPHDVKVDIIITDKGIYRVR
ncbi:MAG: 5-formyltetrahydrofolate cyclo-ligase [Clostridium sp.]|nr:5-formyltetrahydrofolate cyclo-ligase [Clostridium sp.]